MRFTTTIMLLALACLASPALGVSVTPEEIAAVRRLISTELFSPAEVGTPDVGLVVTSSSIPIERDAHRRQAFLVGGTRFEHGIYCHANGRITVRLPEPAKTFSAKLGIDTNPETTGAGSAQFLVRVGGRAVFTSKTCKEGMPAESLQLDLQGAKQFELEVTDAGDGIAADQAVWADARVELASGCRLWLSDLPISGGVPVLTADVTQWPFSFVYGGRPSAELLKTWELGRSTETLDDHRRQTTLSWTDPATGLVVRCVGIEYADFPTVEWTLWFKNTGTSDAPILERILPLDLRLTKFADPAFDCLLHHQKGTVVTTIEVPAGQHDYEPLTTLLKPKTDLRFAPPQGRPCAGEFPYFNLESLDGGLIVVVGWPGAWAAQFTRDDAHGLHVTAGLQVSHFSLKPGEEVRTPLIVLQTYQGNWIRGQNIWRRWMLAHNLPRSGGKPLEPMLGAFDGYYFPPDLTITDEGERQFLARYQEERLQPDCWWVDAGWYSMTNKNGQTTWTNVGTWEVDPQRFPQGLRPVFDRARAVGIPGSVLWFEPERVTADSWLFDNRPQWLLGRPEWSTKLLNFGNRDARQWATDRVDQLLKESGVTIYREDFNMGPIDFWTVDEPENRQGLHEIQHVTGHLAFWDELLRRDPRRLIDTCASGGHRLDLETLRRSVPLWRSDFPWDPIGQQCQTYGLSLWEPYHGTGVVAADPYTVRSDMAPFFLMSWDMRKRDFPYEQLRELIEEWRRIAPYYLGDFYPLTNHTLDESAWMAWQFDRPELQGGMIQVFRRPASPYETARFRLKGLDPNATYVIRDAAGGEPKVVRGEELLEEGHSVTLKDRPSAVSLLYTKQ